MSEHARVLELTPQLSRAIARQFDGRAASLDELDAELERSSPRLLVEVLAVKQVEANTGVSYGHTYLTPEPTTLVLAAMGYGDGLPRKAGNHAEVAWRDSDGSHRLPIVGRVAMNAFVVDAGTLDVKPGDCLAVFGDPDRGEIALVEWAASVGESGASLLAALEARVTRRVTS